MGQGDVTDEDPEEQRRSWACCQRPKSAGAGNPKDVNWSFVGEARGSYEPRLSYTYVGEGNGSFDKEEQVIDDQTWRLRYPNLVGTVALLFAAGACVGLSLALAAASSRPGRPGGKASFDCSFEADWQTKWSKNKRSFCCKKFGRGCEMTHEKSPAFNCKAKGATWKTWTAGKKAWCCEHAGVACYDCDEDFDRWAQKWPVRKKVWCCQHKVRGCPAVPPSEPAEFDCDADFANWQSVWTEAKQDFCCRQSGKGCVSLFDCQEGLPNWMANWSPRKKDWCCARAAPGGAGCMPTNPGVRDCDTRCSFLGRWDTCRGHLQFNANHRFGQAVQPCQAAQAGLLEKCPECSGCPVAGSGCVPPERALREDWAGGGQVA